MRPPEGVTDAMTNRLLAALADVPAGIKPHFGRIARQLGVTATMVTVGVWQLVSAGKLDRETLRPVGLSRRNRRTYCRQPEDCAAHERGRCRLGCAAPEGYRADKAHRVTVRELRAEEAELDAAAAPKPKPRPTPLPAGAHVWCGQCDRRVPAAKAVNCQSRWCSAELPPHMRECPL